MKNNDEVKNKAINNIEKLSRITQDSYFKIKSQEEKIKSQEEKIKSQEEKPRLLYCCLMEMFDSRLYKLFIRFFF